jgi:hypothetical protein
MRFVQVCESGHLGDVDWWWWAHSGRDRGSRCEQRMEALSFQVVADAGGGLGSLEVRASCGAKRSLEGITQKDALQRSGARCTAGQPWQHAVRGSCDSIPQVVQRGASNLHFPRVASALDIPPESNYQRKVTLGDEVMASDLFAKALKNVTEAGTLNFIGKQVCDIIADDLAELGASPELVASVVLATWSAQNDAAVEVPTDDDLDLGEFNAFLAVQEEDGDFLTEPAEIIENPDDLGLEVTQALVDLVGGVTLAHRLREVRALTGFTRLRPAGDDVGVFILVNESALVPWERSPEVFDRVSRTAELAGSLGWEWLPEATPRFIALHTLAHLLIRRLTFECGYSSASLREKIYAREPGPTEPMSGILIYTAAGDAEGSLGGLVRQGEAPRMARTILAAAADAAWCSTDPICSETRSGPGALNLGACHACSLIAETSCGHGNLLLDRTLLTGDGTVPGLLSHLMDVAVTATVYEESV